MQYTIHVHEKINIYLDVRKEYDHHRYELPWNKVESMIARVVHKNMTQTFLRKLTYFQQPSTKSTTFLYY